MSEWISVKDRLPDNYKDVLAYHIGNVGHDYCYITYWDGDKWEDATVHPPTHWFPLPEPPKDKN